MNQSVPKNIRFTIHTQYYPPEIGAPQSRLSELAHELGKHGIKVNVITAMPNYPTGKTFKGYSGIIRKEITNGIQVFRSYIYPTQSTGFARRLLNYFSFVISSFFCGLFSPKTDFIFTESPPLFLGITGYLLSRIKKGKWIFNVADLWPASVAELGLINKNSITFKISQKMEGFFYRKATLVTGQSKTILEDINKRFPEVATYHLSNGVTPENYQPAYQNNGKLKVMYAGLHGIAQGLDLLIDAAMRLTDHPAINFVLIGDGPEKSKLLSRVNEEHIANVQFLEPLPKDKIPQLLSTADILIVPLKTQLTGAVPSKLYEAMAAGKPVILIAASEAAEIVTRSECGIVVNPGDLNALTNAIIELSENPDLRKQLGQNGRASVIQKYDRKKIVEDFVKKLESPRENW